MAIGEVKNIRNLALIDRLYNLFETEGGYKEPPQLNPNVQTVVEIGEFNKITKNNETILSAKTTAENIDLTVPVGKKWVIMAAQAALSANTRNMYIAVYTPDLSTLILTKTSTASDTLSVMPPNVELTEGYKIRFNFDTGTSCDYYGKLLYLEKDI